MSKFKVGDRVSNGSRAGVVQIVAGDGVRVIWDGIENRPQWWDVDQLELESADELTELRAFKTRDLEKHPDLAEPETDEEAAVRIAYEWHNSTTSHDFADIARNAIAWARSNQRDK